MLTIKEISEKFNISKSTLYGWEADRPELFQYLQNASNNLEQLRELTIILDKFSNDIRPSFELAEIEFLLSLELRIVDIEHIEYFHKLYSYQIIKDIKEKSDFVMPIYGKLERLNLIEKYIFTKRYKELIPKLAKTKRRSKG